MRSTDKSDKSNSRIGPKSRLQLTDKLAKFQNTVDCRDVDCGFTSSISMLYKHMNMISAIEISIGGITTTKKFCQHLDLAARSFLVLF